MTIRVNIAELECLRGSVRRLLMNMSNHTHDVDVTQAARRWIPERFWSESAHHRHTFKGQAADCSRDFLETLGESCGMKRGGDDDGDEVDASHENVRGQAAVLTIGSQKGLPDHKVVGELYNKLSNDEMARLQVLGICGTLAHKDDPHKKAFRPTESNITRELDRRGEVAALVELRLHDDDAHVNDQHMRMADQIVGQFAGDINTEQLQGAIVRRERTLLKAAA